FPSPPLFRPPGGMSYWLQARSHRRKTAGSRTRSQRMSVGASGDGASASWDIHCASKSTWNPSVAKSRHEQLSFREQPGDVSIAARMASTLAAGSSVTASGYRGGDRFGTVQPPL